MTDATAEHNYTRFHPGVMMKRFVGEPNPGETAPDFSARTLDGRDVRFSDFRGRRHVELQFGSVT